MTPAPVAAQPPRGTRLDSLRSLPHVMAGWRAWYVLTLLWNVVTHVGGAVAAGAAAYAVALAVRGAAPSHLWAPTVLVLVVTVIRSIAQWQEMYTSHDLSFRVMARFRTWIFSGLARIAPGGTANRRRGDLASITMNDSEVLEVFLAHTSLYRIGRFLATPIILVGLAVISPAIALVCVPFILALLAIPMLTRRASIREGERARRTLASMAADVQEDVGAVREIVAFGLAPQRRLRLEGFQDALLRAQTRIAVLTGIETASSGIAASVLALAATGVGVVEVAAGRLDLVWLPVAVSVAGASTSAIQQWIGTSRHTGNTAAASRRIEEILEADSPLATSDDAVAASEASSAPAIDQSGPHGTGISVHDVHFTWPGGTAPALDGVDLQIAGGETVALAGRSGAGKSTLAQLIARWYDPSTGQIELDGVDVRGFELADLRARVRLVPQDPHLFAETVRENLLLAAGPDRADDEIPDEALWEALETAGVADAVRRLPAGLDSVLSDHGRSLSGGERQRLALARAALHVSDVLILDEAVSQLDTGTAARVQEALGDEGRTTIVVAHRLVTLLSAPRIVVLEAGRVIGDGTHEELLAHCPGYRALVAPQLV